MSDFLTDDGSQRDGIYPTIEMLFVHTESGEVVASKTYVLRDRSAFQTRKEVDADAALEVDRIAAELDALATAGASSGTFDGVMPMDLAPFRD